MADIWITYEGYQANSYVSLEYIGNEYFQTFTIGDKDVKLTQVLLYIGVIYAGNLRMRLYATDETGKPTGLHLLSKLALTTGFSYNWLFFDCAGTITLSANTKYAIGFKKTNDTMTAVWVYDDSAPLYAGGERGYIDSGGVSHLYGAATDFLFAVGGEEVDLAKPINPDPEHEEVDVASDKSTISWENGGGATSYDIYFGAAGRTLFKLGEQVTDTSWKSPLVKLHMKDYNISPITGYRSPKVGDVLTHDDVQYVITRVELGDLINASRYAKLWAFRTSGAGGLEAGDVLTNGVAPDVDNPQAVSVTLSAESISVSDVEEPYYPNNTAIQWRVDARDD